MTQARHQIPEEELVAYVLGDLGSERSEAIERLAREDGELAGQITVLRFMAGLATGQAQGTLPLPGENSTPRPVRRNRFRSWAKAAAAAILLTIVVGVGWAGWAVLTAPLLQDDFNDGWFDSRVWLHTPEHIEAGGVKEERGYLRLVNRGYLVTRKEFPEPLEVSFDWKWMQLGLKPQYADHLAVVLRTSGTASPQRSWEIQDGIMVSFNTWTGQVHVIKQPGWDNLASTDEGAFAMPSEQWHRVRITDDGKTISVYLAGPAIDKKNAEAPLLRVTVDSDSKDRHIAIYNRELLADVPHESYVDNLVIRSLPEAKK